MGHALGRLMHHRVPLTAVHGTGMCGLWHREEQCEPGSHHSREYAVSVGYAEHVGNIGPSATGGASGWIAGWIGGWIAGWQVQGCGRQRERFYNIIVNCYYKTT